MAQKANLDISEKLDITCRRGDSFELTLNIKDSASVALPLSTDNYQFFFQVKSVSRVKTSNPSVSPSRRTLIAGSTLAESPTRGENVEQDAESPVFAFVDKDDLRYFKTSCWEIYLRSSISSRCKRFFKNNNYIKG